MIVLDQFRTQTPSALNHGDRPRMKRQNWFMPFALLFSFACSSKNAGMKPITGTASPLLIMLLPSVLGASNVDERKRRNGLRPWWITLPQKLTQRLQGFRQRRLDKTVDTTAPVVMDAFLSEEEASQLLERYEPLLRASLYNNEALGGVAQSRYRTSSSVRLPPLGDSLVFQIEARAASFAKFEHYQVEDFQLACYDDDQLFGLHRDDADQQAKSAHRSATVLIYLQAPSKGGSTLFTRRPLEDERDLKSNRPLQTEKDALTLFRSYCKKPRRGQVVVEAATGRAVTWRNWYNQTDHLVFARNSTHGACPVVQGRKCVIQQWIALPGYEAPLRAPNVAAIFTAGADASFRERLLKSSQNKSIVHCLNDVSTQEGFLVDKLCLQDVSKSSFIPVADGPFSNVGGLRVPSSGPLVTPLPLNLLTTSGLTVSFWARDIAVGTTLLSIEEYLEVILVKDESHTQTYELRLAGKEIAVTEFFNDEPKLEWLWFSLSTEIDDGLSVQFSIFSQRGQLHGTASARDDTCRFSEECIASNDVDLRLMAPPQSSRESQREPHVDQRETQDERRPDQRVAFVTSSNVGGEETPEDSFLFSTADISFVVIHLTALGQNEARALRHQASRYNVDS